MQSWEIGARESIRDLVARYNSYGDSGRIDSMIALFMADAILEVPGYEPIVGAHAIRAFFCAVATGEGSCFELKMLHHHTATHQIDVFDKQRASGRCYFAVYTQSGLDHWGRYVDAYRRIDQRWMFQSRKVTVDGMAPGGWAENRVSR
ncbi:MAG: nuclear transport factor 2 family protein [Halioglobus sp.]|nr:nuclear transport factor 2 family protein [Halioglobus sp.]